MKMCKYTSVRRLRVGISVCFLCAEPWHNNQLRTVSLFTTFLLNPCTQALLTTRAELSRNVFSKQQSQKLRRQSVYNLFSKIHWQPERDREIRWYSLASQVSREDCTLLLDMCLIRSLPLREQVQR